MAFITDSVFRICALISRQLAKLTHIVHNTEKLHAAEVGCSNLEIVEDNIK